MPESWNAKPERVASASIMVFPCSNFLKLTVGGLRDGLHSALEGSVLEPQKYVDMRHS